MSVIPESGPATRPGGRKGIIMKTRSIVAAATIVATVGFTMTTVHSAQAATCSPKTDININESWTHVCGIGDWVYNGGVAIDEIRDASAPFHRIWLHNYWDPTMGVWQPWSKCVYGSSDYTVPVYHVLVHDVQVSANTSPC
jgi:hypothetical protein